MDRGGERPPRAIRHTCSASRIPSVVRRIAVQVKPYRRNVGHRRPETCGGPPRFIMQVGPADGAPLRKRTPSQELFLAQTATPVLDGAAVRP